MMKLHVFFVFCCMFRVLFCVDFEKLNWKCGDSINSTTRVVSLIHCVANCVSDKNCCAFTFKEDDMVCNLHSTQPSCCVQTTGKGKGASYRRKGCPDNWMQFNEKCYFFGDLEKTSEEAGEYCKNLKSKLAEPMSDIENTFLRNKVNEKSEIFLIGVTDSRVEGEWVYASSLLPVKVTDWKEGEPDNFLWNEHCAYIEPPTGKWVDITCDRQSKFICEKSV